MLPTIVLAVPFLILGGAHGLVWGYLVSTVLLWHGLFSINSVAHVSLTTGEGWHNNHHHYQSSANQGFRWWEIDVTYYVLRALAALGLVWDLRRLPPETLTNRRRAPSSDKLAA